MFERLVVAYDGSEAAGAAVDLAFELADRRGAQLTLAHALEQPDPYPEPAQAAPAVERLIEAAEQDWEGRLAGLAAGAPESASVDTEVLVASKPAPALLGLLDARRADLLLAGTHGVGGFKQVLGSVSQQLLEHAPCSVLLVREDLGREASPTVIAGVDGSAAARAAVVAAQAVATTLSAPLLLVHVIGEQVVPFTTPDATREQRKWASEQGGKVLAEARATVSAPLETVSQELRTGLAKEQLVLACEARRPRLAVVGSRGLHGFKGLLLGSTSRHLVNNAPCPVLVVRTEASQDHVGRASSGNG